MKKTILLTPLLLLTMGRVHAQSAAQMTLGAYHRNIAAVHTVLDTALADRNQADQFTQLRAAQTMLDPVARVSVSYEDSLVTADNRWLVLVIARELTDTNSAHRALVLKELAGQTSLLTVESSAPGNVEAANRAAARAKSILSGSAFASDPVQGDSALTKAWNRFWSRLYNRLRRWFHQKPDSEPMSVNPLVPEVLLILIGVAAAVLLIIQGYRSYIAYTLNAAGQLKSNHGSGLAMTADEEQLVKTRDFDQLLSLAAQKASDEDFRSGIRLVYLATLVFLDSQGVIRLERSRTNWEYLQLVRRLETASLTGELAPMTQSFDRNWYGLGQASKAEYQEAVDRHHAIRTLIATPDAKRLAGSAR